MTAIFADTSYFLALLVSGDAGHAAALDWSRKSKQPLVTTEYVVVEVGNFLSASPTRHLFAAFLRALNADTRLTVVPSSPQLLKRASELYTGRNDKTWSLTDCTSFIVMQDRGIREAVTADHHFEQAGYAALLVREG